uniref:Bromo domain-containing protein n=1 Tax=Steinernema glaseri TaxID=37863 RepID=A0A1I8A725_9BILA
MENQRLLPARIDFAGRSHDRRMEEYDHLSPGTGTELLDIARTLFVLQNDRIPRWNLLNGAPIRFITGKKQSLTRTKESVLQRPTICDITTSHPNYAAVEKMNVATRLMGRELGGRVKSYLTLPHSSFTKLRITHRILGHLSPIFCVNFDRTGRYVFTGADDCLIKVWDVEKGTLRFTFRGHERELSDISVNRENTMLATGSIDKTVRVFCLRSGKTLEVFNEHTAQLTVVRFLPYADGNDRYLMSTGNDGIVNFYKWNVLTSEFEKPTRFNERDVPNQRIVSYCYSPGGTFVAFGDTCRSIRIFRLSKEGVSKLVVITTHNDRVDSMEWANTGIKFLSGSKDGVAKVWCLENGKFKSTDLVVEDASNSNKKNAYRLTILCWSKDDSVVVTAGSDHLIRIWNWRNGTLRHVVKGHDAEAYVLVPHPIFHHYVLSAGHDGFIMVWDVRTGKVVTTVKDTNESQVNTALFDMAVSPDGTRVAAVDCQGCLLMLGINDHTTSGTVPDEQFFNTDYKELAFDQNGFCLDAGSGLAPHLMPPPILITGHGFPHDPSYQHLVPGRDIDGYQPDEELPCPWLTRNIVEPLTPQMMQDNLESRLAVKAKEDNEKYDTSESVIVLNTPAPKPRPTKRITQASSSVQNLPPVAMDFSSSSNDSTYSESREGDSYLSDVIESGSEAHAVENGIDEEENEEASDSDFSVGESRPRPSRQNNRRNDESTRSSRRNNRAERRQPSRSRRGQREEPDEPSTSRAETSRASRTQRSRRSAQQASSPEPFEAVDESSQMSNVSAQSQRSRRRRGENNVREERECYPEYPQWMKAVIQRRFPFIPQVGDEVVYFSQGHQNYLDNVREKNLYEIRRKMNIPSNVSGEQHCVVKKITYEVLPPHNCRVLRLILGVVDSQRISRCFTVWTHDIENVPDFLIPRQLFQKSIQSQHQRIGAKMQSILSNQWWTGKVLNNKQNVIDSSYQWNSIVVRWENGDEEAVCPWDYDLAPDQNVGPRVRSEALVTPEELEQFGAIPLLRGAWTDSISGEIEESEEEARENVSRFLRSAIEQLCELPEVKIFADPVDLTVYTDYIATVRYPIDLGTINERLRNKYYRRKLSLLVDIWYIAENAKRYNVRSSDIVNQAKVLTETLSRLVSDNSLDPIELYEEISERAPNELTFWRQIPQANEEYLLTHSTLETASQDPIHDGQPWIREASAMLDSLLEKCKTLDDNVAKEEITDASRQVSLVYEQHDSLRQMQTKLLEGLFESPEALSTAITELINAIKAALEDYRRSQEYNDVLTFINTKAKDMKTIIMNFARAQEADQSNHVGYSMRERTGRNRTYNTRSSGQRRSNHTPSQDWIANGRPPRAAAQRVNFSELANGIDYREEEEEPRPSTSRQPASRRARQPVRQSQDEVPSTSQEGRPRRNLRTRNPTRSPEPPQTRNRRRVVEPVAESDSESSEQSKDESWSGNEEDDEDVEEVEEEAADDDQSQSSSSRASSDVQPTRRRKPPKRYVRSSDSSPSSSNERRVTRKKRKTEEPNRGARQSTRPRRSAARPARYQSESD